MFVYILHGYRAKPSEHWFPWLKNELEQLGAQVQVLDLPDLAIPKMKDWVGYLNQNIQHLDQETFFIAHSLGCITLLRFLEAQSDIKLGGAVFVSGFARPLLLLPQLIDFVRMKVNFKKILDMLPYCQVILSKSDIVVPAKTTRKLAACLRTKPFEVENAGHFLQSDGYTEFPLVLQTFKKMLDTKELKTF